MKRTRRVSVSRDTVALDASQSLRICSNVGLGPRANALKPRFFATVFLSGRLWATGEGLICSIGIRSSRQASFINKSGTLDFLSLAYHLSLSTKATFSHRKILSDSYCDCSPFHSLHVPWAIQFPLLCWHISLNGKKETLEPYDFSLPYS